MLPEMLRSGGLVAPGQSSARACITPFALRRVLAQQQLALDGALHNVHPRALEDTGAGPRLMSLSQAAAAQPSVDEQALY